MRGIGWVPIDSLEVEKAKKAGEILSEKKYRQHPEKLKYTYSMDTMEQALNKSNKLTMNKVSLLFPAQRALSVLVLVNSAVLMVMIMVDCYHPGQWLWETYCVGLICVLTLCWWCYRTSILYEFGAWFFFSVLSVCLLVCFFCCHNWQCAGDISGSEITPGWLGDYMIVKYWT